MHRHATLCAAMGRLEGRVAPVTGAGQVLQPNGGWVTA
jgi:hypothetical protein